MHELSNEVKLMDLKIYNNNELSIQYQSIKCCCVYGD